MVVMDVVTIATLIAVVLLYSSVIWMGLVFGASGSDGVLVVVVVVVVGYWIRWW